jgi:Fe-S-cluster containining protein
VAACCKQNGHVYSVLLEPSEYARFGPFSIELAVDNGAFRVSERVIPYREGRCLFLGEGDLCTIYDDRPQSCRRFECVRGYHHGGADVTSHGDFLLRNPHVRLILDEL